MINVAEGDPITVPDTPGQARTYLMCPPEYFDVSYAINPWMDPDQPVDTARAKAQWTGLHDTFARLGHRVHVIDPVPGLPDMVFAANGHGDRRQGPGCPVPARRARGGGRRLPGLVHPQRLPGGAHPQGCQRGRG